METFLGSNFEQSATRNKTQYNYVNNKKGKNYIKLPIDTSQVPYHIWCNNGYIDWLLIPDVLETLATYANNPRLWNSHPTRAH